MQKGMVFRTPLKENHVNKHASFMFKIVEKCAISTSNEMNKRITFVNETFRRKTAKSNTFLNQNLPHKSVAQLYFIWVEMFYVGQSNIAQYLP